MRTICCCSYHPRKEDFRCIRVILDLFAGASGLITNVDKCLISPIRCSEEAIALMQQVFPCQLSPLPCRYLGAPLSVGRLRRTDEQRLVDAVASRIPTLKGKLLNAAGRTTLTRATLSAIPVHVCPSRAPSRRGRSNRLINVDAPSSGVALMPSPGGVVRWLGRWSAPPNAIWRSGASGPPGPRVRAQTQVGVAEEDARGAGLDTTAIET